MGRSYNRRSRLFSKPSLIDSLIQLSPDLDIYIIPDHKAAPGQYQSEKVKRNKEAWNPKDMFLTVIILLLATGINFLLFHFHIKESNLIMIYLLAVLLVSYVTSRKCYGIASSLVIVAIFNFFFTTPRFSLQAYDPGYIFTFAMLFLVSIITNTLTRKVTQQARSNAVQSHRLQILLEASQKLQQSTNMNEIAHVACFSIYQLLHRTIILYSVNKGTLQPPQIYNEEMDETVIEQEETTFFSDNEQAVARWVYTNNQRAGAFTSTLPAAKATYYALRSKERVYAVLGISMLEEEPLAPFERSVLTALLNEIALSMENMQKQKRKKLREGI